MEKSGEVGLADDLGKRGKRRAGKRPEETKARRKEEKSFPKQNEMAVRHVFQVQGMPQFREQIQLTITVPAFAGNSFPVEMDFPAEVLADPGQVSPAPAQTGGMFLPPPLSQPSQPSTFMSTQGSSGYLPPPPAALSMGTSFGNLSPEVQAVSAQRPLSPGHRSLSGGTVQQAFLPSITNPGAPQTAQPIPVSRSSLTSSPLKVLSPRGQSTSLARFSSVPAPGTMSAAPISNVPSQQLFPQVGASPTSFHQLGTMGTQAPQNLTGQDLANQFLATPPTISSLAPAFTLPPPQASAPKSPLAPQLSKRSSVSSLSDLLTSPKMLSPRRFSPGSGMQMEQPQYEQEGGQEGQSDEQGSLNGMLPAMTVYRCAPATDLGEPTCSQVFPRTMVGGQTQSRVNFGTQETASRQGGFPN